MLTIEGKIKEGIVEDRLKEVQKEVISEISRQIDWILMHLKGISEKAEHKELKAKLDRLIDLRFIASDIDEFRNMDYKEVKQFVNRWQFYK